MTLAVALENPPLLVTCDTDPHRPPHQLHQHGEETHTLTLDDLLDGAKRDLLQRRLHRSRAAAAERTRDALTAEAASSSRCWRSASASAGTSRTSSRTSSTASSSACSPILARLYGLNQERAAGGK